MTDVVVVGAGPAGALAALILARAGVRVQLFERARFPRAKLCGDTLNPGAMRVLAEHIPVPPLIAQSLPLDGMLLTGPGGVAVRGRYTRGLLGRSIARRELDAMLVQHAIDAGVRFEDDVAVAAPIIDATGRVTGVSVKSKATGLQKYAASLVIAADGRESRLARAVGLARHPRSPRRWALGGYFDGVDGLVDAGEMHVRAGRYIGVAPIPGGLANACLVVPHTPALRSWRDPARALTHALADDPQLAPHFARARLVEPPHVLGPMAVDVSAPGVTGLLLAGDAAGFIDPITGDGLRFALGGAVLAAAVAQDILAGRVDAAAAVTRLAAGRQRAFGAKWRFNRTLRALVASTLAVGAAAVGARLLPAVFESVIRYAGDCQSAVGSGHEREAVRFMT
jgi:flavin-dependent dehydrogenase